MKKIILMAMIALSVTACQSQNEKSIVRDANATVRNAKNFNAVEVSGAIDLYLSQGSDEAVAVSGSSDEVTARIKTEVSGGVLKIYFEGKGFGWKSWGNTKMKAYVTFKNLDRIEASGACNVKATQSIKGKELKINMSGASDFSGDVAVDNINLEASGASNIKITGSAVKTIIEASGACNIRGYDFKTDYCNADASGASNIKITVAKELNVDASGGSCVFYKGTGSIKSIDATGGSSVKRADN